MSSLDHALASLPPIAGTGSLSTLMPGDRHPWVGSMYIDYCRAFTIAATGGVVIIPSGKDERCSAAMMLGSDDGLSARELTGQHYRSKPDVESIVEALLGAKGVKVAA
jgi:hypothetical protein